MRNLTLISTLPYEVPQIVDVVDVLPKRGSWETLKGKKYTVRGQWDGRTYHTGFRKPEDIDTIVIHHAPPTARLETHAANHGREWGAGLAYHLAIDNGMIKQTNNLLSMTYHCRDNNTYTVGIVVNRDLRTGDLSDQERELLYAAILSVKSVLPIKHIKGHSEIVATQCPCTSLNRIRSDIEALEQQIAYNQSAPKKEEVSFRVANTIMYYYNMAKGKLPDGSEASPGKRQWAQEQLLKLEPDMRRYGMLK